MGKIKDWYEKYEGRISSVGLIGGFIFTSLTLTRVDLFLENFWIVLHLFIAGLGILLLNFIVRKKTEDESSPKEEHKIHFWLILMTQFAFGGLFSTFFVFYVRSSALSASWPFLLIIAVVLIGNEIFKKHYVRLSFQTSIFFLSLYLFAIFLLPLYLHRIGDDVFLLSGIASLGAIALFIYLLRKIIGEKFEKSKAAVFSCIAGIFILMNAMYFANVIPPIPLSQTDSGVYHNISRDASGNFVAMDEAKPLLDSLTLQEHFHKGPGESVYVWSSIFSPANFATHIIHEWQFYDTDKKEWVTSQTIDLPISGGRDGGFRTYSQSSFVSAGLWRVNVETQSGQVIGRIKFTIENVDAVPALVPKKL